MMIVKVSPAILLCFAYMSAIIRKEVYYKPITKALLDNQSKVQGTRIGRVSVGPSIQCMLVFSIYFALPLFGGFWPLVWKFKVLATHFKK